ncbi:hypothetical protein ACHHV8_11130 [Paenibacillus sp. TAB 01]
MSDRKLFFTSNYADYLRKDVAELYKQHELILWNYIQKKKGKKSDVNSNA